MDTLAEHVRGPAISGCYKTVAAAVNAGVWFKVSPQTARPVGAIKELIRSPEFTPAEQQRA
jgi:hypothetical protein